MKKCYKCQLTKELVEFSINKSKRDGLSDNCKDCHKQYNKNHYEQRKGYYVAKAKKAKLALLDFVREAKNIPCTDCKQSYPWYVMDFDHLQDKSFNLGEAPSKSKENILKEMAKCEVVCSNCHRERTHKRTHILMV